MTLKEVVDEVGVDAARYFFLSRSCDSHLDFDLDLAKQETPENPVFYIQYAHARICSVFRTAEERGIVVDNCSDVDLSVLDSEEDYALIKKILAFPEVVEAGLAVDRIGSSSVTYAIGLFGDGGREPAATGHFVHVFVDRGSRRPTTIPEAIRSALEALHQGEEAA
mgnify:CR=1 FL=1